MPKILQRVGIQSIFINMKKLNLNKKTISQMDRVEMNAVNGGDWSICIASCKRGTRKGKNCCGNDEVIVTFIE